VNRLKLFVFFLLLSGSLTANPIADLEQVGSATLKVYFWTVYNSSLYSQDGKFSGVNPYLALEIEYRRDISNAQLISRTAEEWEKQNIFGNDSEQWLKDLREFWPDIKKGDVIVLRVNPDLASEFYLNAELIGTIADKRFTNDFLAIWLSENTSYPKLRDRLVGLQ